MEEKNKISVIFDFDWSLIDENSDTYIAQQLDEQVYDKIKDFRKELNWTEVMQEVVSLLNEKGHGEEEFHNCFKEIPLVKKEKKKQIIL